MTDAADIQVRSFRPTPGAGAADPATAGWLESIALAFHEVPPTREHAHRVAQTMVDDSRVLTGAYESSTPPPFGWDADRPVATLATFEKELNVGAGRMLEAHLIADVTVRPTHRRRGLMRRLLTADLRRAASDGAAIAALHAMEATIYGRFGFGPATFAQRIEVDISNGLPLTVEPAGSVGVVDATALAESAPSAFDRFHAQTTGSVRQPASFASRVSGTWAEHDPPPAPGLRAAVHWGEDERVDGYVTYRFDGWDRPLRSITVVDFVAASLDARFGLWKYLAAIDLVQRVKMADAPIDDPLPWTLEDRRRYSVVAVEDGLWLRILDPIRALESRAYDADGSITIEITDPLGIAAGVYRIEVESGRANVARSAARTPDALMEVAALGSLFLGGVTATMLQRTGHVVASAATAHELDRILAHRDAPFCLTGF